MQTRSRSIFATPVYLCLLLLVGCQSAPTTLPTRSSDDTLRLGSWNIHYIWMNRDSGRWSRGHWENRKPAVDATFKALDADVVAFQEMESFSGNDQDNVNLAREWLLTENTDYRAAAVGDWREFPSTQPFLYRDNRLTLLDQGWFFFSDTPDVIYSHTFNGSFPAFASWAQFEMVSTGAVFRVINVHLDFSSRDNRRQSIALILDRSADWRDAGEPVFLVGDLNGLKGSRLHRPLTEAGFQFADVKGATYHFERGINLFGAIDHLTVNGDTEVTAGPWVLRQKWDGVWPSDHYPVVADFQLPPSDS